MNNLYKSLLVGLFAASTTNVYAFKNIEYFNQYVMGMLWEQKEPFFDTAPVSPLETSNINYSQAEDFFIILQTSNTSHLKNVF